MKEKRILKIKTAAILAGGESSRFQQVTRFKAMAQIAGESLINRLIREFLQLGVENIIVALNAKMSDLDFVNDKNLSMLKHPQVKKIFVSTPSSMHTLYEVFSKQTHLTNLTHMTHLLVSMVDTIVKSDELKSFYDSTSLLNPHESLLLTNHFIDDEKPLTVKLDSSGQFISAFAVPLVEDEAIVTSGMYCFSSSIYPLLEQAVNSGQEKLRNFLAQMLKNNYAIKNYTIAKTIDVDRPEDLEVARIFLRCD
ncbi:MAG: NTP transferase domain-containing protein [Oligoflexia bacterium]|nr:NTP transferase domain-containing protein [Oligoflexia bacterium]